MTIAKSYCRLKRSMSLTHPHPHPLPSILTTFNRGTIESDLTSCLTLWYRTCTASNHKIVRTAERILRVSLLIVNISYNVRRICKATSIADDPNLPSL